MFEEQKTHKKLVNETVGKLIKLLEISNDWHYDDKFTFTHKESEIVLNWGIEYSYDDSYKRRDIVSPIKMSIPRRFKKQINESIEKIKIRDRSPDDLSFFNAYLHGEYRQKLEIDKKKKSEITVWMIENDITQCHIMGDVIWFKNEEDAMAVKLTWMD